MTNGCDSCRLTEALTSELDHGEQRFEQVDHVALVKRKIVSKAMQFLSVQLYNSCRPPDGRVQEVKQDRVKYAEVRIVSFDVGVRIDEQTVSRTSNCNASMFRQYDARQDRCS